ncbi:hypothetical protein F5Y14DRAFT_451691 [Nemania sp. NC0429]|nr:hypothetical protein F5Y14DRAFT_451691 [Nemania sp. NC0429]
MASSDNLITIDPDGDAIIAVSKIVNAEIKKVRFRVSRRIADALKLPRDKCEIQLAESDAASLKAMELLFRCMGASGSQDLPTEFYRLTIDEVWRVLALVDITSTQHHRPGSYNVPSRVFRKWFAAWFKRQSPELTTTDQYARLLYPAFALQELEVFASITKWLAYNDVGQIREQSLLMEAKELPSRAYRDMHMPKDVISTYRLREPVTANLGS